MGSLVPDKWVGNWFKASEFACHCGECGRWEVHSDLISIADLVREHLKVGIRINSGVRCVSHNENVGGKKNSLHLPSGADHVGCSAEFSFLHSSHRHNPLNMLRVYTLFESFSRRLEYGVGLGLYATFVHFDVRGARGLKAARWSQGFQWPNL